MASLQEEMEDSRSSAVGRKRNLDDLQTKDSARLRHSSSESDVQNSSKRLKSQVEQVEDAFIEDGLNINTPSVPSPSLHSETLPTAAIPPRPVAWNKGVQSGLRTSFGSRVKAYPKPAVASPQDEDSPPPSNQNPDSTNLPETHTSTPAEEAEAAFIYMAATRDIPEDAPSPVVEQNETPVRSSFEEPSLHQMGIDISSTEEEGEILSARGTGEDAGRLPHQTSTPSGHYAGEEAFLSNSVVNDAASLQASRQDSGDDGQHQGNVSIADLQPRERFVLPFCSTTSEAEELVGEISSTLQPNVTPSTFQMLTNAEETRLSRSDRATYMRLKKDHLKEQKQQNDLSKRINSLERLTAEAEAILEHEVLPLPQKYDSVTQGLSSGLTFFPRKVNKTPVYQKNNINYRVPEIFDRGKPIRIQQFSFDIFAPAFLKENPSGWDSITLKSLIAAYNMYRTAFYSIQVLEIAGGPRISVDSPQMANAISLDEAKRQARLLLNDQSTSMVDTPENHGEVLAVEPVEIDINSADINPLDRELQQKYFPAAIDHPASYHCLACGDKSHMMIDCPSLTCASCGGNHALSSCPQSQRCEKCRTRGHRAVECPEKLVLSKAEAVGCDLCGSIDHLEKACHFIWRTFRPKSKEIRKVHDIARHCYMCGGSNHYGPECGLYNRDRIYSGGETWSKANLLKYIDASGVERAMSAGIDYSIGKRPSKGFSIKGKANNPIELNDNDDNHNAFISEKVKKPKQRGQIRIAGTAKLGQPSQESDYSRAPNPPRQSRPNFGSSSSRNQPPGVDGARYGRERTFSPPPRLDDMRYGFSETGDHFRPQAPQQRENSYRQRSQQALNNYQSAPQLFLPMRPPPTAPNNASRSGQAGRGGRGGGNEARGGGEKRRKRIKGAGRGGGADNKPGRRGK